MNNFFAELKRRNVYKVAVAYGVVAWLLFQAASILLPTFEAPTWVMKAFTVFLALGFILAVIISWAFEMTPEGLKPTADVSPDEVRSMPYWSKKKFAAFVVGVAVIAAGLLVYQFLRPKPSMSAETNVSGKISAIPEKSIAVLPFDNLSDEKSNAYFAEGIQDEILTRLSKIAALKVISRTSTQKYKSAPDNLREVGQQLGVATLLEGSVQKIANAVHVNVQLIRAANDEHIWAESYNRKLDDVFGVEGEVANAIAEQLNARLTGAEEKAVQIKSTENPAAYDAYLRGISIEQTRTDDAADRERAANYTSAVQLDPKFALAWARLAVVRSVLYFDGFDLAPNTPAAVKEAADQALALQPDLGEAYVAQGVYRYRVLRDFNRALESYNEALKRLPNSSYVFTEMAHVERRLSQWDAALKHYRAAVDLDPRNVSCLQSLADFLRVMRQFSEAEATCDRILEISPGDETALVGKVSALQAEGRLDESARVLTRIRKDSPNVYSNVVRLIQLMLERRFDDGIAFIQSNENHEFANDARTILTLGLLQESAGRKDEARAAFNRTVTVIKPTPGTVVAIDARGLRSYLGWAYAALGQNDKAIDEAKKAIADYNNDALSKPFAEQLLAIIQTRTGDFDSAMAALPHLLEVPNGITPAMLRLYPWWDPLRKDPRFQKLCEEPAK